MRRETMEDMARMYAREAAFPIAHEQWEQACKILLERCRKLDMALQSLTPGGSEYVGDPDRCVARAKENLDTYRKLWKDAVDKITSTPETPF